MNPQDIAHAPVIGITGRAGAGKTTVANWFLRNHKNVIKYSFASPLKAMFYELVRYALPSKWPTKPGDYINSPDLKEQPMPFLDNHTPRRLMQTLGTEWGRNTVAEDFWLKLAQNKLERQFGHTFHSLKNRTVAAVFDDVRFANEAAMLRDYKGCIVRIERPGDNPASHHTSEDMDFDADVVIVNDGTEDDLIAKVASLWPVPTPPKG
jgi:hypothetical protein